MHSNEAVNNTQNVSRADIQRRVRTISTFYNTQIKERFEELGFKDWAYEINPEFPMAAPSRYGDEEARANYTMVLPEKYARPTDIIYAYSYETN
jgi:hypothetical protein